MTGDMEKGRSWVEVGVRRVQVQEKVAEWPKLDVFMKSIQKVKANCAEREGDHLQTTASSNASPPTIH